MTTTAFTTITSFKVVLLCKTAVSLWRRIIIAFLDRNNFFHFIKIRQYKDKKEWIKSCFSKEKNDSVLKFIAAS
jgi:hypothetical protein